ncbi:hypothetical protein CH330_02930 [candidate division WOR-3 bacterium JGI_Cruoil_03_51_56]|uniref:Uncharacterized protein n=1 Tax=candidate division WOR-3 bacterium JGI_Cruoil_03_51_56 TaxID=1973747 RepID=A0A235BXV7_UNCW3|nr:MAG: hypothetical protein CH330_02930 [candidate division WOR-3 bacterium JGI_Cruoil_03_51_56]
MGKRIFGIIAMVAAGLALARLVDAAGKKALIRTAQELNTKLDSIGNEYNMALDKRNRLELDRQLLSHRIAAMSRQENYLVINRRRRRLQLAMGNKIMLETGYKLRGSTDGIQNFLALPKAVLEVLGKRTKTDWCRPDWLYRLEGIEPPADSTERLVPDAFGPGELFLGGGIALHGRVKEKVPPEAIDHTYIELDNKWLAAVVNAVKPGSLVFIQ